MRSLAPAVTFISGVLLATFICAFFIRPGVTFQVQPEPVKREAKPVPELSAADSTLLGKLMPHIERGMDRKFEAIANELDTMDVNSDGKLQAGPYAIGETILASAIFKIVKKLIVVVVTAMIVTIIWKILLAKIGWVFAAWVVGVILPAWLTARLAIGRQGRQCPTK